MDAAAAAVQAWATRPAFEPDATVNAHRAGLGACYGAAARLEFAGSLNVDATTAAELAAEAELEARVAACAARERRCHDFREEVEACLGTLARVGSCRDEAGAKAAEVTSACDAILDAQRALVVEAEKYDDALGDLEPVAPARLARVSAEAADDVEDFEAAVRELEGKLARVDARRARGEVLFRDEEPYVAALARARVAACDACRDGLLAALRRATLDGADAARSAPDGDGDGAALGEAEAAALLARAPLVARLHGQLRRPPGDRPDVDAAADRCGDAVQRAYWARRGAVARAAVERAVDAAQRGGAAAIARDASAAARRALRRERELHGAVFGTSRGVDARDERLAAAALGDVAGELHAAARASVLRSDDLDGLRDVVAAAREARAAPGAEVDPEVQQSLERLRADAQERATFVALAAVRAAVEAHEADPAQLAAALEPGAWYGPLRATLKTLSKLHGAVDAPVFDDLARHAVAACVAALRRGADALQEQAATADARFDALLFAISHLLVLRERIAPLGIKFGAVTRELDWRGARAAAAKLRPPAAPATAPRRGVFASIAAGLFGSSTTQKAEAIGELAQRGMPTVDERAVDAKRDLELELKRACAAFVALAHREMAKALNEPLKAARLLLPNHADVSEASPAELTKCKQRPFAQPAAVGKALRDARGDAKATLDKLQRKCADFLENANTRKVLLKPAKAKTMQSLREFAKLAEALLPRDLLSELDDDVAAITALCAAE